MKLTLDSAIPAVTGVAVYGLYRLLEVHLRGPQRSTKDDCRPDVEPEPCPEPQDGTEGPRAQEAREVAAPQQKLEEIQPVCRCGSVFLESDARYCKSCGSRRPEAPQRQPSQNVRRDAAAATVSVFGPPMAVVFLGAVLLCCVSRLILSGDVRPAASTKLTATSSDVSLNPSTGDVGALFSSFESGRETRKQPAQDAHGMGETMTIKLTRQVVPLTKSAVDGRLHYKSAYWGTLSVGTPAQAFKVVVDTGSGHVILPSTYCHSATCRSKNRYRRSSSSTGQDIDVHGNKVGQGDARDLITVSFGTGEIDGVFMEDVVCLGGDVASASASAESDQRRNDHMTPGSNSSLPDGCMPMRMIVTTDMTEEPFDAFEFDGILGLGLQALSQSEDFNFMREASHRMFSGATSSMFAIHLSDDDEQDSEVTFGGWAPERLGGGPESISWNPVIHPEEGHWLINVKSLRVGDTVLKFCEDGCKAVTDTGTSLLAVPPAIFPELFTLMAHKSSAGHCKGPGPLLHIELENTVLTLGPKDWARVVHKPNANQTDGDADFDAGGSATDRASGSEEGHSVAQEHLCNPTMMTMDLPAPLGPKLFILGEPIIRRYYAVFDPEGQRVGFGPSRD